MRQIRSCACVLNSGCCCNKDTIDALKVCVAGEDTDGNPPETSVRVKAAAFNALQNCLMKVPEVLPQEESKPIAPERGTVPNLEPLPGQKPIGRERSSMNTDPGTHVVTSLSIPAVAGSTFERQSQNKTLAQTVDEARHTLVEVSRTGKPAPTLPPGKRSLLDAFIKCTSGCQRQAQDGPLSRSTGRRLGSPSNLVHSQLTPRPRSRQSRHQLQPPAPCRRPPIPIVPRTRTVRANPGRGLLGLLFNSRNRGPNE